MPLRYSFHQVQGIPSVYVNVRISGNYIGQGASKADILQGLVGFDLGLQKTLVTEYGALEALPHVLFLELFSRPIAMLYPSWRTEVCMVTCTVRTRVAYWVHAAT